MPKENINCIAVEGLRTEVSWGPGHVQVATTNAHSAFAFPAQTKDGKPESFNGWFASLDRDGCNRAIRALRKARDAAFGADA